MARSAHSRLPAVDESATHFVARYRSPTYGTDYSYLREVGAVLAEGGCGEKARLAYADVPGAEVTVEKAVTLVPGLDDGKLLQRLGPRINNTNRVQYICTLIA